SNINRPQSRDDILTKLDTEGIKDTNFIKVVEKGQAGEKSAEPYRLATAFVSEEPGAGLIRNMPDLIPPEQLIAHWGRGSSEPYAMKGGERVFEELKDEP